MFSALQTVHRKVNKSAGGELSLPTAHAVSRRDGGGPTASFGLKVGESGANRTADFPVCCVADFQIGRASLILRSLANGTTRRLAALRHSRLGSLRYNSRAPHPLLITPRKNAKKSEAARGAVRSWCFHFEVRVRAEAIIRNHAVGGPPPSRRLTAWAVGEVNSHPRFWFTFR